ncbi:hypothetical protein [Acinetobacter pragensis]|uniref:Uncharacterized protein n=1 Tax=Acinetobacter pragensis TaxID=1806892 RepID=A0A151XXJ5_9GAMM|nr:hypothetical protein [Acinetobacter pragensis]KYQ70530.1 hypothetical protein AZH43_04305 [Acinetobacter pragensis]
MKKVLFFIGLCTLALNVDAKQSGLSTESIKQKIIQQSIEIYPGNCPCPYNTASNGSRCGKRSAYNRAGGYAPLCYPEDVSDRMVKEYKGRV